jgi:hypothetical protein
MESRFTLHTGDFQMPGRPVVIVGEVYDPSLGIGGGPVYPPIGGGAPGYPAHPIVQPPLGIWGGAPLPWPTPPIYYPPGGGGQPGYPAHPIAPTPGHPIVLPPGTIPGLKPEHPIYIPPPTPGVPTHPIVLPPPGSSDKPEVLENWDAKAFWTPDTGWTVAIVPSESHPGVPTPSAGRRS